LIYLSKGDVRRISHDLGGLPFLLSSTTRSASMFTSLVPKIPRRRDRVSAGRHHPARSSRLRPLNLEMLEARTLLTFSSPAYYPALGFFGGLGQLAVGDFTGNGQHDIAVCDATLSSNGPVGYQGPFPSFGILLNNGDGTFGAPITHSFSYGQSPEFIADSIATGDFTGTGRADLVIGGGDGPDNLEVLLSNGDGTFTKAPAPTLTGLYAVPGVPSGLVVGDFNHDGKLDFAAAQYDTGQVSVFMGNGNGSFQLNATYNVGDVASGRSIAAVDMTKDGNLDLVVCGSQSVSVLLGNGDGTFQNPVTTPITTSPGTTLSGFAVADFTSDGTPDVAVGANNGVDVLPGNGNGTFGQPTFTNTGNVNVSGAADFNGSGHQDLITRTVYDTTNGFATGPTGYASIFPGNGDGTFGAITSANTIFASGGGTTIGSYPIDVAAADFDSNGSPDLAVYFTFFGIEGNVALALNQAVINPVPALSSLGTTSATEGSSSLALTVNGSNFQSSSTVQWNGVPLTTSFVSSTQLQATVPAADLADEGTVNVTVQSTGGRISNGLPFVITVLPPAAGLSGPGSGAVNQSLTFALGAVSPSPADQAAGFSYAIDWGDGTAQNPDVQVIAASANNGSGVTASHAYAAPGAYAVQVTATDDGGTASTTVSQGVNIDYNFSGFASPVGHGRSFGIGRTIPLKFQLTDSSGNLITNLASSLVLSAVAVNADGSAVAGAAPFVLAPAGNSALRWDPSADQYVFNWSTKGLTAGYYDVLLLLPGNVAAVSPPATPTLQLSAKGASAALTTATAGTAATATAGALLAGGIEVYINDPSGLFTTDQLARIQDAVNAVDSVVEPFGASVAETTDSTVANVVVDTGSSTAVGGFVNGVLGCTTDAGEITIVQGWSWYAGADATQIGSGQYDFQTVLTHELGHALGLGHSALSASVMCATLNTGEVKRSLAQADLNVADADAGAGGLRAAVRRINMPSTTSPTASESAVSAIAPSSGVGGWNVAPKRRRELERVSASPVAALNVQEAGRRHGAQVGDLAHGQRIRTLLGWPDGLRTPG
jgi:hypothetical protein